MLTTVLSMASPPTTYIPIESGPVSMLLVSLDDIDIQGADPLQHRKGGFFDAMSTAIEVANRQGIRVIAHVTSKSSLSDVKAAVDARGLKVEIHPHRTDSVWIRDYGPTLYVDGKVAWLFDYVYYDRRPRDDLEPRSIAHDLGYPLERLGLLMEGGNLLSNGAGVCLTSDTVLSHNYISEPRSQQIADVSSALADVGCAKLYVLDSLQDEATGHVDIYMTWASPQDLIVGVYTKEQSPANHAIMRRNIQKLAGHKGIRIHELPMPDPYSKGENTIIRTWINLLFLGDSVIVPTYDEADGSNVQQHALQRISDITGKTVVPINGEQLISERGSIHCLTKTIPQVDVPPAAAAAAASVARR